MTPKQIIEALRNGSEVARQSGRPDRHRIMLSSGTIIDSAEAAMMGGVLVLIDMNKSVLYIDPIHVILIANALAPAPDSAEIEVQAGELQQGRTQ